MVTRNMNWNDQQLLDLLPINLNSDIVLMKISKKKLPECHMYFITLTNFMPLVSFSIPPEIRKPDVF